VLAIFRGATPNVNVSTLVDFLNQPPWAYPLASTKHPKSLGAFGMTPVGCRQDFGRRGHRVLYRFTESSGPGGGLE
jgi:hypothetical protein